MPSPSVVSEDPINDDVAGRVNIIKDDSVASGADETKYLKHKRSPYRQSNSRRSKGQQRLSWHTFSMIFFGGMGLFLLYVYYDSNRNWRHKQGREHLMKRALHILAQRNAQGKNYNIPLHRSKLIESKTTKRKEAQLDDRDEEKDGDDKEEDNARQENNEQEETEKPKKKGRLRPRKGPGKNRYDNDDFANDIDELRKVFQDLNDHIRGNLHGGIRWIRDQLLKELPGQKPNRLLNDKPKRNIQKKIKEIFQGTEVDYNVRRMHEKPMAWQAEWDKLTEEQRNRGPKVDFTKHSYTYPKIEATPPEDYPPLEPLGKMLTRWPQDSIDDPPTPIVERLMRFDYSNMTERQMALSYRDAELPFKVYNVPEVDAATAKWTDDYLIAGFDGGGVSSLFSGPRVTMASGQESPDNFFAWFTASSWHIGKLGPPPYRNNDWDFRKWNEHAKYADAVSLSFDQPHFYWQAGVPREERYASKSEWTFVSHDLPSFSSTEANFFQFNPDEQKGIQCRFGERGVTAATHYDSGRNMIAMIQGAKRYILSPPRECSKLGIVTSKSNPIYRHSLLNFGHIQYLDKEEYVLTAADGTTRSFNATNEMPKQERKWLELSRDAMAIDTVLKAGEVLYVPSHWFHYISSLQKSAQCNVRSGIDDDGTEKFGGPVDVEQCR